MRRPLEHIAFWQGLGFLVLILAIWTVFVLDLPSLYYGETHSKSSLDFFGASVLSAISIVVAFIVVGNTFVQQKRVLKGFITVCSYCRKVKIDDTMWNQIEEYIGARTLVEFTHGICPACFRQFEEQFSRLQEGEGTASPATGGGEGAL